MKHIIAALAFGLTFVGFAEAKPFKDMFPEVYEVLDAEEKISVDTMDMQEGKVKVGANLAELDLPKGYYFLGAKDARVVLENLWGNPQAPDTLGMIFPEGISPFHNGSWAIEIFFDDIGYVSDEDAGGYDYDELLTGMQKDTKDSNTYRRENGYDEIELLGWAAPPHYDAAGRKLYWAKRLRFGESEGETLNYNIRALGRKGVLVLNFIAGMEELEAVEKALPDVLNMVTFTEGNRYGDFKPGVDTVAAVGIGGLIAGKVLAKTGLLVVILAFAKKFAFLLILPIIAGFKLLFRRGKDS
ncbi:MAG: DUF2167 domain-containing protein [Albidovulum sp.]